MCANNNKKNMNVGTSLWISHAVLLTHYAVYGPIVAGDARCTAAALWGPFGPAARAATVACALAAFAILAAAMWTLRRETDPGLWLSAFAFYLCQSAFLPALRRAKCGGGGGRAYAHATRGILAAAAAAIVWFIVSAWRSKKAPRAVKYATLFLAVPFVLIDFLVYAWVAV